MCVREKEGVCEGVRVCERECVRGLECVCVRECVCVLCVYVEEGGGWGWGV